MLIDALLFLAQGRGEQEPPDTGVGLGLIVGVLLLLVLGALLLHFVVIKGTKASKGGVQPPADETGDPHPGQPPVESVEPRS